MVDLLEAGLIRAVVVVSARPERRSSYRWWEGTVAVDEVISGPPEIKSLPKLPHSVSLPGSTLMVSSPGPPKTVSAPGPPAS